MNGRKVAALLGGLALATALLVACEPDVNQDESPITTASLGGPRHANEWEVTDAKVWTRDDFAYWIVSYDARWIGTGRPERETCLFQTKDEQGVVIRQTEEAIEEGDDLQADAIYPDEVPGQPESVSVDCD